MEDLLLALNEECQQKISELTSKYQEHITQARQLLETVNYDDLPETKTINFVVTCFDNRTQDYLRHKRDTYAYFKSQQKRLEDTLKNCIIYETASQQTDFPVQKDIEIKKITPCENNLVLLKTELTLHKPQIDKHKMLHQFQKVKNTLIAFEDPKPLEDILIQMSSTSLNAFTNGSDILMSEISFPK